MVDTDQSGYIDAKEFHVALTKLNIEMTCDDAQKFFAIFDSEKTGQLSYENFIGNFGAMIAGSKDTGSLTSKALRGDDIKAQQDFSADIHKRMVRLPPIPHLSVVQIKDLIAKRMGNKYASACAAFREIDRAKKGVLGLEEFRLFLKFRNIELREEDFLNFVNSIDADGDGEIDYQEFLKSFGDAICGAPWETAKTGLDTSENTTTRKHTDILKPKLLSAKEALSLLHFKLAETTTSVNRVFKRFNKGRAGHLTPKQFEHIFDNFNLAVDETITKQVIASLNDKHRMMKPLTVVGTTFEKNNTTEKKKKKKQRGVLQEEEEEHCPPFSKEEEGRPEEEEEERNLFVVPYGLFCLEFGPTISGSSYVGVVDPNAEPCKRFVREPRDAPFSDPEEARKLLVTKLRTHFKHNRTAFTRFNTLRDGALDFPELRAALRNYHINLTDADFLTFAKNFDKRGMGSINFDDFLANVGQEVSGTTDTGLSIALQDRDASATEKRKFYNAEFQDLLEDDGDDDDDHPPSEQKGDATHKPENNDLALFEPQARQAIRRALSLANLETKTRASKSSTKGAKETPSSRAQSSRQGPTAARRRQAALDRARQQTTRWRIRPEKNERPQTANPKLSQPRIITHHNKAH